TPTPTPVRLCFMFTFIFSAAGPSPGLQAESSATLTLGGCMAELLGRLQQDLNAARKAQDKASVLLLGTIIADARNREIELRRDLTDDDVVEVLRRGIKKRRESMEMYEKGGRPELAATEKQEAQVLG